jgi:hypothetical protein
VIDPSNNALLAWAHDKHRGIGFEFFELTPIRGFLPGYREFRVRCETSRGITLGMGQARGRERALVKAIAEAVERQLLSLVLESSDTTNGLAVHADARRARLGARLELIERDAYLCHHLTRTGFVPLPRRVLAMSAPYRQLKARLAQERIALRAAQLDTQGRSAAAICCAFGHDYSRPFGGVIGLGSGRAGEMHHALAKSVLECWTGILPIVCGLPFRRLEAPELRRRRRFELDDHEAFALGRAGGSLLRKLFDEPSKLTVGRARLRLQLVTWPRLPAPFADCPLVAAHARCNGLQDLFFGKPSEKWLHRDRLRAFASAHGRPRAVLDLHSLHCLP